MLIFQRHRTLSQYAIGQTRQEFPALGKRGNVWTDARHSLRETFSLEIRLSSPFETSQGTICHHKHRAVSSRFSTQEIQKSCFGNWSWPLQQYISSVSSTWKYKEIAIEFLLNSQPLTLFCKADTCPLRVFHKQTHVSHTKFQFYVKYKISLFPLFD